MKDKPEYYEFYGELVKSNIFYKRFAVILIVVNLVLGYLSFLGFTRPVQTYVVKDGYAYATEPAREIRSIHECEDLFMSFPKVLEYNRENFNERFKRR
jgi:hypothetical protein